MICLKFVEQFFKCGPSKPKNAAERAMKRLNKKKRELNDAERDGRGGPPEMAQIIDLRK